VYAASFRFQRSVVIRDVSTSSRGMVGLRVGQVKRGGGGGGFFSALLSNFFFSTLNVFTRTRLESLLSFLVCLCAGIILSFRVVPRLSPSVVRAVLVWPTTGTVPLSRGSIKHISGQYIAPIAEAAISSGSEWTRWEQREQEPEDGTVGITGTPRATRRA
jgi:hypothetical protein